MVRSFPWSGLEDPFEGLCYDPGSVLVGRVIPCPNHMPEDSPNLRVHLGPATRPPRESPIPQPESEHPIRGGLANGLLKLRRGHRLVVEPNGRAKGLCG